MFVSKINGLSNLGFKGYQHIKNDVGESIYKFNYPYNSDTENCEVQIFKVVKTDKLNHKVIETPIANIALKPGNRLESEPFFREFKPSIIII